MPYCSTCGSIISSDSAYCSSCGSAAQTVLNPTENQEKFPDVAGEEHLEKAFVGGNYDYFRNKWSKSNSSWNWAAFLIGFAWLPYRKMYLYSSIFVAVIVLEILFEYAFDLPQAVSNAVNIGIAVTFGMQGNYWYRLHVEKKVKEIRALNSPQNAKIEVARQGGTNIGAAIGFLIAFILIMFLVVIVAEG